MSRLMSVSMTEQAVVDRAKTVTRRKGWWTDKHGRRLLRPGDRLTLVRKAMGRKLGSAEDLTGDEAALVIEALRSTIDAPADVDAATGEVMDAEVIEDGQPAFDDAAWMAGGKQ